LLEGRGEEKKKPEVISKYKDNQEAKDAYFKELQRIGKSE
jgi:hypothetical protein